jgi:hypothetical protein
LTEHVLHLFENRSYRETRRRLQELVKSGFLFEQGNSVLGRKPLLRLTSLGAKIAASETATLITQKRVLKTPELSHDAIVTSARIRLESIWSEARFVPEHLIKHSQLPQIPDGIFYFQSGKGIAIEVENSDKGRSRFLRLLERWNDVQEVILVLYIATNEALFACLKKYLSSATIKQPTALVLWAELQEGLPLVWTPRGLLPLFERKTF